MGGGTDVDDAFKWMIDRSGGGDFLVLRASGDDDYNPYIYSLGQLNSCQTILTKEAAASADPFVLDKVKHAAAIWIAGGDQGTYARLWEHTPLQQALQDAVDRGVPIGGTSAGLAILGNPAFTARIDSITSEEALAHPKDARITLEHFLVIPHVRYAITDSHFTQRDRLGRLVTFVANEREQDPQARGLGIDERTALLVEPDGEGTVVGEGRVSAVQATHPAEVLDDAHPLTMHDVQLEVVPTGGHFNVETWTGTGVPQTLQVDEGKLNISEAAPAA